MFHTDSFFSILLRLSLLIRPKRLCLRSRVSPFMRKQFSHLFRARFLYLINVLLNVFSDNVLWHIRISFLLGISAFLVNVTLLTFSKRLAIQGYPSTSEHKEHHDFFIFCLYNNTNFLFLLQLYSVFLLLQHRFLFIWTYFF